MYNSVDSSIFTWLYNHHHISFQNIFITSRGSFSRFLELYVCSVLSSPVLCPTNSRCLSLPEFKALFPQLSEIAGLCWDSPSLCWDLVRASSQTAGVVVGCLSQGLQSSTVWCPVSEDTCFICVFQFCSYLWKEG